MNRKIRSSRRPSASCDVRAAGACSRAVCARASEAPNAGVGVPALHAPGAHREVSS